MSRALQASLAWPPARSDSCSHCIDPLLTCCSNAQLDSQRHACLLGRQVPACGRMARLHLLQAWYTRAQRIPGCYVLPSRHPVDGVAGACKQAVCALPCVVRLRPPRKPGRGARGRCLPCWPSELAAGAGDPTMDGGCVHDVSVYTSMHHI